MQEARERHLGRKPALVLRPGIAQQQDSG